MPAQASSSFEHIHLRVSHKTKILCVQGVTNADLDVDAALALQIKRYAVLLVTQTTEMAVYAEPNTTLSSYLNWLEAVCSTLLS